MSDLDMSVALIRGPDRSFLLHRTESGFSIQEMGPFEVDEVYQKHPQMAYVYEIVTIDSDVPFFLEWLGKWMREKKA